MLRATQFHDLALIMVRGMAKMPVIPAPSGFKMQPIDAAEVAARLVALALDEPAGFAGEIGGPRVYGMDDLTRSYLMASGKRRPIIPMHLPGRAARAMRAGANLAPGQAVDCRTWEDFLADRLCTQAEPAIATS
jgi:uncharacterized protein YbjT (DUF2867 family)